MDTEYGIVIRPSPLDGQYDVFEVTVEDGVVVERDLLVESRQFHTCVKEIDAKHLNRVLGKVKHG